VWASLTPVKKPGSVCRVRVTQNTSPVSAISLECCPPSPWNGVRHHAGTLSAISVESCPPWRGIRNQTIYDWTHYIALIERKPGALRNGAPFKSMPEPLRQLQDQLLRHPGGDRVMAQVLTAVSAQGLEAVLVAVELALQSGRVSAEHVLNVLSRLKEPQRQVEPAATQVALKTPSQADLNRYDRLRQTREARHA
jgi:hypothetical protein